MHPWLRDAGKDFLHRVLFRDGFMWRLPPDRRAVALTFDDGPNSGYTPAVLDLLAREKLRATFFVVGSNVAKHPEIARRLVGEGHAIGGHTYDHREIVSLTPGELESEMSRCRQAIRQATGVDSMLFRPPRGKMNLASVRRVCRLGYRLVHWTKTYSDYQKDGVDRLVERMLQDPIRSRDIVLLHDHNSDTLGALAQMIPQWKQEGIEFESI